MSLKTSNISPAKYPTFSAVNFSHDCNPLYLSFVSYTSASSDSIFESRFS